MLDMYWWLALGVAALAFAIGEFYALRHPERQNTLSRTIHNLGRAWPLSIFLMGMFVGALAVHFFWNWCPELGIGTG